ncbi:flagellar biosynthetic protein FliO [Aquibacillus saliphilus]|uniref:flagellar biosynthetic protein FliO n=1 Tax=Aquibacillus saliphilus TaxID=1909422 RepID=UPI001CF09BA8|nr:flagellar biosynthetic protein FliO [Aquibacillus saliphilus]
MIKKIVVLFSLAGFFLFFGVNQTGSISAMVSDCKESLTDCEPETSINLENESDITGDTEEESIGSSPNLFLVLLQLVLALAFILALIYFLLKFINGKNKMFQKVRTLENLGGIPLGSSKSIQVVKVGERVYVLGVGDNVELLSEVTDQQTKEDLLANDSRSEYKPGNFLASIWKRKDAKEKDDESKENFTQLFQSELSRLAQGRKKLTDRHKKKEDDHHE